MKTVHLNGYIQVEKYPFIENSESHCNEGFVLFNELGEQFAFCWDNLLVLALNKKEASVNI